MEERRDLLAGKQDCQVRESCLQVWRAHTYVRPSAKACQSRQAKPRQSTRRTTAASAGPFIWNQTPRDLGNGEAGRRSHCCRGRCEGRKTECHLTLQTLFRKTDTWPILVFKTQGLRESFSKERNSFCKEKRVEFKTKYFKDPMSFLHIYSS